MPDSFRRLMEPQLEDTGRTKEGVVAGRTRSFGASPRDQTVGPGSGGPGRISASVGRQWVPSVDRLEAEMSDFVPSRGCAERVAVLGPGGVGGLLAGVLARSGAAVTCLARPATVAVLARQGIRVESELFGDFTVPVGAAERLTDPVDVCFVTSKATQLEAALERLPADVVGSALVVPLLNGVEHLPLLRQRYPAATVVPATVRCESARVAPGVVRHTSPFVAIELAEDERTGVAVRRLAGDLERAGVTVKVSDDAATVMWSKLTFLAALALLTTAAQAPAGAVREDRRDDLLALVTEASAVAQAEGAAIDAHDVMAFFDGIPAGMRSSMQRDADAGRPLELDAIGGAVVREAARHGIAVPVTSRYVDELRARYPR
jgi:2-dehydropantoate 2-reductase